MVLRNMELTNKQTTQIMNLKKDEQSTKKAGQMLSSGLCFLLIILWLCPLAALANSKLNSAIIELGDAIQSSVSGTITDASGTPLPGASIVEKGTTNGTQTDFDGNYEITLGANAVLVVSYLGFISQEITVDGKAVIDIMLKEDSSQLDEVVITGYTKQNTRDITGSVSTVEAANLEATAPTSVEQALQGQAAGVVVGSQGGPGGSAAVRIRGFGTINGNDPLYIVDGTPTGAGLNDINPNDIESVQILKDASSAAIYGNRAANGVIIITTKGGKRNSKTVVSANVFTGIDFIPSSAFPQMASPQQVAESVWREFTNTGATPSNPQYGTGTVPTLPNYLTPQGAETADESLYDASSRNTRITRANKAGTNWFDEYFNAAVIQNYNVSASGGTESANFFTSMSVLNQDGVGSESGFKRYTIRANSTFDVTNGFRIGENITVSYSDQIIPPGSDVNGGTVASLYRLNPLIPVRDVGGNYAGSGVGGLGNGNNALAIADRNKNNSNLSFRALGNMFAELDIVEGLTLKTNLGFDLLSFTQINFLPPQPEGEIFNTQTSLSEQHNLSRTYTWFNTLNYTKSIGDNIVLDAIVGTEFNKNLFRNTAVSRQGFDVFTPEVRFFDNASQPFDGNGQGGESSYFSIFGKADVKISDKYLLSATVRRDATSLFNEATRDGIFPSGSVGWRISSEEFMKDSKVFTDFMIKAGYGIVGNNGNIRTDARSSTLGPNVGNYNYPTGSTSSDTGLGIARRGNPNIGWETTSSLNFGFNARLFEVFTVDLDLYDSTTEDMLLNVPGDPTLLGNINSIPANLGEMNNKGFDLAIGYSNLNTKGAFNYNVALNVSAYKNEVVFLDPANEESFINGDQLRDQFPTRTQGGQPLSSFYGNTWTGIGDDGRVQFDELDEDGVPVRDFIGNPHPDFTYGLIFNGDYKNIDFSLLFQGSQGNDIYNFNKFFTDFNKFSGGRSLNYVNEVGLPAVTSDATLINREAAASTYYVEDGSYLRLKNIVVGYSLPKTISDKLSLEKIRFYLQGKNLITLTDYTGLDPEINLRNYSGEAANLTLGVDTGVYPISRSVILGLNVSF